MGHSLNSAGEPVYSDVFDLPGDLQAATDYAKKYAWSRAGTASARGLVPAGELKTGLTWRETDTGLVYWYDGSGWKLATSGTVAAANLMPPSMILTTTVTEVAGLALAGCPTGIPMILDIDLVVTNGASGGQRFIDVQAYNGATGVDALRRFSLPLQSNVASIYTINYPVFVTPSNPNWTLRLGVDQNSSVVLTSATLRLSVKP